MLDRKLYEMYGHGHQAKVARAIGVSPNTVNQLLAPTRREILRKIERHVEAADGEPDEPTASEEAQEQAGASQAGASQPAE